MGLRVPSRQLWEVSGDSEDRAGSCGRFQGTPSTEQGSSGRFQGTRVLSRAVAGGFMGL